MKKIRLKNDGLRINRIIERDSPKTSIGEYKLGAPKIIEDPSLPVAMRIKKGAVLFKNIYEGENGDLNLIITGPTIPQLTVDKAVSIQLKCNQAGVTWFLALGELPPGITLSSSGKLSGTPERPGSFYALFGCKKDERVVTKGYTIVCGERICKITFNANGGTCTETSRQVMKYTLIGNLPTPVRSGQVFGGWYTASTGGLPVDSKYTVIDDVTLYARWGQSSNIQFGEPTTQFNIQYMGDRTNFNNNPYTLYGFRKGATTITTDLVFQTGIQSSDGSNNLTNANTTVKLFLKITNHGEAGYFNIGFDCDSYIIGDNNDRVSITRLSKGLQLGSSLKVTVDYPHTAWHGQYSQRTNNRLVNTAVGSTTVDIDSGYAFTMNDIFINNDSYTILEITYKKI